MRKVLSLLLTVVFLLSLAGCACTHEWLHATGGHEQICDKCGAHQSLNEPCHYLAGTYRDCENPRICISCGKPEAEATNHQWVESGGNSPRVCTVCGKIDR